MKLFLILLLAALSTASVIAAPIGVSLVGVPASVTSGDTVNVAVVVSGLETGAAPSLGAFDFTLNFESAILSFSEALFGNQLDLFGLGSLQFVIPDVASVQLQEISFDTIDDLNNLQLGSFALAFLRFDAIGNGAPNIFLSDITLSDAEGNNLDFAIVSVPEPATVASMIIGFAALALLYSHGKIKNSRP